MRGLLTGGIGFALGIAAALVFEDKPMGRAWRHGFGPRRNPGNMRLSRS